VSADKTSIVSYPHPLRCQNRKGLCDSEQFGHGYLLTTAASEKKRSLPEHDLLADYGALDHLAFPAAAL